MLQRRQRSLSFRSGFDFIGSWVHSLFVGQQFSLLTKDTFIKHSRKQTTLSSLEQQSSSSYCLVIYWSCGNYYSWRKGAFIRVLLLTKQGCINCLLGQISSLPSKGVFSKLLGQRLPSLLLRISCWGCDHCGLLYSRERGLRSILKRQGSILINTIHSYASYYCLTRPKSSTNKAYSTAVAYSSWESPRLLAWRIFGDREGMLSYSISCRNHRRREPSI